MLFLFHPLEVQSLAQQSDLEAVVKTLAPALMAELAKIKSSSADKSAAGPSPKKASTPRKIKMNVDNHGFVYFTED